jgi:hypothetical protein
MIVVVEEGARLGLRRVRTRDRLLARFRSASLDAALAAGASPESSVALAVHAGHLCESTQRREVARTLARISRIAEVPRASRTKAPVSRNAVRRCSAELTTVVERLAAREPVSVQGVARIRTLLADGTGPLYGASSPGRLRRELLASLEALDALA